MKHKQKILHILTNSVFSPGYINFMKIKFPEYNHYFIINNDENDYVNKGTIINDRFIYHLDYSSPLEKLEVFNKIKRSCDAIIVSGFFFNKPWTESLTNKYILKKLYIQFWGGDFYCYRDIKNINSFNTYSIVLLINKYLHKHNYDFEIKYYILNRCAGYINLVEKDYYKLLQIMHLKEKTHFCLPMPNDPTEKSMDLKKKISHNGKINILVGNSASQTNMHKEALSILSKFRDENIKIYCPLSYGDNNYGKSVISFGKSIFKNKFIPITHFMKKNNYVRFLNFMDIALFDCNRQQALGNIGILLGQGKKVYLRSDTSMFEHFIHQGCNIFNINKIKHFTFKEFCHFPVEGKQTNMSIMDIKKKLNNDFLQWNKFFINVLS